MLTLARRQSRRQPGRGSVKVQRRRSSGRTPSRAGRATCVRGCAFATLCGWRLPSSGLLTAGGHQVKCDGVAAQPGTLCLTAGTGATQQHRRGKVDPSLVHAIVLNLATQNRGAPVRAAHCATLGELQRGPVVAPVGTVHQFALAQMWNGGSRHSSNHELASGPANNTFPARPPADARSSAFLKSASANTESTGIRATPSRIN